jgi:Holliday junction resolvasome RuvABC ATP-dependent DNA helicase subunit
MVDGGKKNVEWLLHLLQDGVLMLPTGPLVVPNVTVIAATTDVQRLPQTIIDRFFVRPQITEYSEDDAVLIALAMARGMDFGKPGVLPLPGKDDWLRGIARAGNCNPRKMLGLLVTVRDLGLASAGNNFDPRRDTYDLSVPLDWHGLTEDGLDEVARKYLVALATIFDGTAGEKAISNAMNEPGGCRLTEQLLTNKGFLTRGPRGRSLTDGGWDRAQALAEEEKAA